jgi:TPR repeat protein
MFRLLLFSFLVFVGLAPLAFASAADILTEKARLGDAKSQLDLAMAYANGEKGLSKNTAAAAEWFRLSANQGNRDAEFYLGVMYAVGESVPQDSSEAAKWYRKAAEQGQRDAAQLLGSAYVLGEGVGKDMVEAHLWLDLAGQLGNEQAKELLAGIEKTMTPAQIAESRKRARDRADQLKKKAP